MQDVALLDPGDVLQGEGLHRLVADYAPDNHRQADVSTHSDIFNFDINTT